MFSRSMLVALALLSNTACATTPSGGSQTTATSAQAALADNAQTPVRPDFSGIWERFPDPFEGGLDYPPPPGGTPPLREPYLTQYNQAIAKRDAIIKSGALVDDPSTRCLPEGMPTIMGGIYAIEFVQARKQIVVLAEFLSQTRRIYIDETMPPADDIFPSYNGYSVAHWEGDTLVARTIGVRDDVLFMNMPHSAAMEITERIRLTSPDRLEDQVTITDPTVFTSPYSFTFGYKRLPDYKILENICDNNRYSVDASGQPELDTDPTSPHGGK